MTSAPAAPPLFAFVGVGGDSPLAADLERMRALVAERGSRTGRAARSIVSAEIKGRREADGWQLDRFSWSEQVWGEPPEPAFRATTLYWREGHGPARWLDLPEEPYLQGLERVLPAAGEQPEDYEVLRYVPLRRFTWRQGGRVHKVKRSSRLADSYARAAAVVTAAHGSPVRVPALRGTTDVPRSYSQDLVEGDALADLACGLHLLQLLTEAGEVHAQFGALPARGLPEQRPEALLPEIGRLSDWVGALLPELRALVERTGEVLRSSAPGPDPDALATCHGDLVPSHLLGGPGSWWVIDLDLAHAGDRYRDLALFLAGLAADVPELADGVAPPYLLDEAEQAYLEGYAARWGRPLDARRLAWHRAAAELHVLGVQVSKDRVRPRALVRSAGTLERALGELEGTP